MPKAKEAPQNNTAEVLNRNGHIVRVYSLKANGKDYLKLANQFVEKKDKLTHEEFRIVEKRVEKGVVCPSCGHEFRP